MVIVGFSPLGGGLEGNVYMGMMPWEEGSWLHGRIGKRVHLGAEID